MPEPDWNEVAKTMAERSAKEHKEFNEGLPEPDAVVVNEFSEFGYWGTETGSVIRYQKYDNGYNRASGYFFTTIEISAIVRARAKGA